MATLSEIMDSQVKPFVCSDLLSSNPSRLSLRSLVLAWLVTKFVHDLTKNRIEVLREALLNKAGEKGTKTGKNSKVLKVEGSSVIRGTRVASLPDKEKVKVLLKKKDIRIDAAFTKPTPDWELDASKLKKLVEEGRVTESELNKLKQEIPTLKVKPSSTIEDAIFFASGGHKETPRTKKAK